MKFKKLFLGIMFSMILSLFIIPTAQARELPTGSNYDYSIDMFTTTYYISYDLDGGNLDRINTYTPENEDFELGIPTKDGYTFLGWTGSNGNIPNPKVIVKSGTIMNLTFKANWKKNLYGINFDLDGGNGEVGPIYYDKETDKIILGEPEKLGFTFKGWTGSNGTTPQKNVEIRSGTRGLSYRANWERDTYDIHYNMNDDSYSRGSQNNPKTSYNIETNDFELVSPIRRGYTFEGWIGTNGSTQQKDVSVAKGSVGERFYKANWKVIVYNISYNKNDATAIQSVLSNPKTKYTIEDNDFTLVKPTKFGYTFKGWTGSNGTTPQEDVTIRRGTSDDKSYVANWKVNTYNISYTMNDDSYSRATHSNPKTTYTVEDTFTLVNPSRTGYNFAGWTGSNGSTKQTTVTVNTNTKAENLSYSANWSAISYSINYTMNGAGTPSKTSYTIEDSDFTLVTPTKAGYTFTGWTGSNGSTKQMSVTIPRGSHGNLNYTAHWEKKVTINFDKNGSSSLSKYSDSCTMYDAATTCQITTPTINLDGWQKLGFKVGSSGTSADKNAGTQYNVSDSGTWYAITKLTRSVSFHSGKGSPSISKSSASCDSWNGSGPCSVQFPTMSVDARKNVNGANTLEIVGWNTDVNGQSSQVNSGATANINGGETYYAITRLTRRNWTVNTGSDHLMVRSWPPGGGVVDSMPSGTGFNANSLYSFVTDQYSGGTSGCGNGVWVEHDHGGWSCIYYTY